MTFPSFLQWKTPRVALKSGNDLLTNRPDATPPMQPIVKAGQGDSNAPCTGDVQEGMRALGRADGVPVGMKRRTTEPRIVVKWVFS